MNKTVLLSLFFISSLSFSLYAQDGPVEEMLKKAEAFKDAFKEPEALKAYEEVLKIDPISTEALINASFLSSRAGFRIEGDERKIMYEQGRKYAERVLAIDSTLPDANFMMGVAMARMAQISPTKQKLEASKLIKVYCEKALKYNRKHEGAWHLLGIWNYEVKELGATKTFLINLIYGKMPKASYENAVDCFNKAINYKPEYILYYKDLAKALIKLKKYDQARNVINKTLSMEQITLDDPKYVAECKEMLAKLK
jgi:tetratricopeptide (TPR) repeat protein